jgi:hypothetical protein
MIHVSAGLLLVLEYGLAVFCFIDVARSAEAAVPWIPRWGWIIAILVFPLAGSIAWLVSGHARRFALRTGAAGAPGTVIEAAVAEQVAEAVRKARDCHFGSLEDDAALLAQLWDVNEEHEHTLRRWEEDLARREEALRQQLRRDQAVQRRRADGPGRDRRMDAA